MATVVLSHGSEGLLVGVESARSALKERVAQLRTAVQQIESELSAELDRVEKEQTQKQSEYRDKVSSLTAIRASIEGQFTTGEYEDLKQSFISDTDRKIDTVESEYKKYRVDLVWEEGLCDQLRGIGRIALTENKREDTRDRKRVKLDNYEMKEITAPIAEQEISSEIPQPLIPGESKGYSSRCRPITTVGIPVLACQYPQGIAYDNMDNAVYILDNTSCNLYSYSINSKTVRNALFAHFTFENEIKSKQHCYNQVILSTEKQYPSSALLTPASNFHNINPSMLQPYGIEFHDNKLYVSAVSRNSRAIDIITQTYLTNSSNDKHINWSGYFGKHGSEKGEMNTPKGLAFSDSHLYVCDSNNNRINVYFNECIVRTFSHRRISHPLDIKIDKGRVFVLNSIAPFVLEFDHTGILKNEFLSSSIISGFSPSFFCIDSSGRFLISDKTHPYVYVFRRDGSMGRALETRLELEYGEETRVEPRGVCIDGEGRVYVVCNYKQAMLQIF